MKILFIVNVLSGGGGERVVQTLANYLSKHERYQITIVTLETLGDAYALDAGIKQRTLKTRMICHGIGKILCIPIQGYELACILREERPDASISFLVRSNLVHILSRRFGNKYPIFLSEHSPSRRQYKSGKLKDRVMRRLIRWLYPQADGVFAVSSGVKDNLLSFGVSACKIKVIYNPQPLQELHKMALELPSIQIRQDVYRLITIGRLIDLKDHETLIKAFAKVRTNVAACLYIIGNGPNRKKLENLAQTLGVGDAITFLGWQPNPFALLKQADLFVLSSRFEGFGNVLVEAMACGLPVVSTDCPSGPREILKDGELGILVPVGDVDALAHAITTLLSEPDSRAEYARRGKERAKEFDVSIIAKEYLEFMKLL